MLKLFSILSLTLGPTFAFPVGPAGTPFGSPSQAIYSPTGGSVIYRSAPSVASPLTHQFGEMDMPQGQLLTASQVGREGGPGRCNVYYYCCIFYCWSKWTPCGCYLICADRDQGGVMLPADGADGDGSTTNEFFDPPSPTRVPDRADLQPSGPTMMMGGFGADKKVSPDDERESVLTSNLPSLPVFEATYRPRYTEPPEIDEHVAPDWDHTELYQPEPTPAPEPEPTPRWEPETRPGWGDDDYHKPEYPGYDTYPDYIGEEVEYYPGPGPDQYDDYVPIEEDEDDTLFAFGQVQGRRPVLVRFPQTGVAFETQARSGDQPGRGKETQRLNQGGKADKRRQREKRRQLKLRSRRERKRERKLKQQEKIDDKFIW